VNLFLRRLWVLIRALLSSKDGPFTGTYTLKYRVWLSDQDMFMHMTNSRYLSFSDLGRFNMLARTGISKALRKNAWRLEVCGQTRTITKMLKTPQAFTMVCKIVGWTEDYLAISHQFLRRGGIHADVSMLVALRGADGTRLGISQLLEARGVTETSPDLSDHMRDLVARTAENNPK
jgi:acyl-CoA thioesterase FadM